VECLFPLWEFIVTCFCAKFTSRIQTSFPLRSDIMRNDKTSHHHQIDIPQRRQEQKREKGEREQREALVIGMLVIMKM